MSNIPVAEMKRASYENFIVDCPWCGKEIVFNRASDLKTFELILGKNTSCLNNDCKKPFRIVGDIINNPHEMLIFDCHELIEKKHYMNCILTLTQAYEVFFSVFFRVEFLYKPFSLSSNQNYAELNRISEKLHNKIKKYTFDPLRALFLQCIVTEQHRGSLTAAENTIDNLPNRPQIPSDEIINNLDEIKPTSLLLDLKSTNINILRNKVVHKSAYRPTREEAESALEETRNILFPLTYQLNIHDDINWYTRQI